MSQHRSKFKRRDCSNLAQIENIFARLFQEGSCIARVPWWNSHAFVYNVRTRTFIYSLSPVQSNNPYIAISNIRDRTFDREARILQTATVVKACDETRILRKNDIAIRSCTTCTRNTDNNTGKNNRKQRPPSLSKLDQLKTHRSNVTSTPEITFFQASPSLPPTPSLPGSREHKDKVNG